MCLNIPLCLVLVPHTSLHHHKTGYSFGAFMFVVQVSCLYVVKISMLCAFEMVLKFWELNVNVQQYVLRFT